MDTTTTRHMGRPRTQTDDAKFERRKAYITAYQETNKAVIAEYTANKQKKLRVQRIMAKFDASPGDFVSMIEYINTSRPDLKETIINRINRESA